VLPIAFTLSSLDAFQRYRALNIQAGCRFADAEFSREVAAGKLQATSLERFTCIALAGVCAEFLKFGRSEGGMSDINQLDGLLKALQVRPLTARVWLLFLARFPDFASAGSHLSSCALVSGSLILHHVNSIECGRCVNCRKAGQCYSVSFDSTAITTADSRRAWWQVATVSSQ
jgi:hypothetical protein